MALGLVLGMRLSIRPAIPLFARITALCPLQDQRWIWAEAACKARLLFLRVFGSSSLSEKLFDLLAARWRYAGSIHLTPGGFRRFLRGGFSVPCHQ